MENKKLSLGVLKTRIENLGLPNDVLILLKSNNIRTVGGIKSLSALSIGSVGLRSIEEAIERVSQSESVKKQIPKIGARMIDHNLTLFDHISDEEKKDVVDTFAEWFGISRSQLVSPSRKKETVEIRDLVIYILREYASMSYPAIGRLLGGRDHTTIIHAHKKIKARTEHLVNFEKEFSVLIAEADSVKKRKEAAENTLNLLVRGLEGQFIKLGRRRELTEREEKILELYREGITLNEIGKSYALSRERVRQIIEKVVQQNAVNQSLDKGITVNAGVLLDEEKKKHRKKIYPNKIKPIEKVKRWSRFHIACKKCGTTSVPHYRRGLCEKCGGKTLYGKERDVILDQHQSSCDKCHMSRKGSYLKYSRDLYITDENKSVFCRGCFQTKQAKKLGSYKNFEWSRFYPKCISCGTTSIPHGRKGFCEKCSDVRTDSKREQILSTKGNACNRCCLTKAESYKQTGRDLYLDKSNELLCRACFFKKRHEKFKRF